MFQIKIGSRFNKVSGSVSGSGFGIRIKKAKMTHKNRKKIKKFHVLKCWMFSFRGLKASSVAWTSFMED
jgi:hypothetical protein